MEVNPNFSENAKKDLLLVVLAREGDQKAYADLMERYKSPIYFMALKMVKNKDDAMDIMVETFGKAFRKLLNYNANYSFSTWLFKIATNTCIDFLRKKRIDLISIHQNTEELGDSQGLQVRSDLLNPEENWMQKQRKEQIKLIIEKLPSKYRILITMHYFDERSYEQIGAILDMPMGTVKGRLFRARCLMFNILNQEKEYSL